jgi:hypothetical protein
LDKSNVNEELVEGEENPVPDTENMNLKRLRKKVQKR